MDLDVIKRSWKVVFRFVEKTVRQSRTDQHANDNVSSERWDELGVFPVFHEEPLHEVVHREEPNDEHQAIVAKLKGPEMKKDRVSVPDHVLLFDKKVLLTHIIRVVSS